MRETTRNFAVGLTAIVAFIGLAWLLLSFGELTSLWESSYSINLEANSGTGLRQGSQVTMNGVPIGSVREVTVRPGQSPPVLITMSIRREVDVPVDSLVTSTTALIGGGTKIDLVIPSGFSAGGSVFAHDGSGTLRGEFLSLEERLMAAVESKLESLNGALAAVGNLANNLNTLVAAEGDGGDSDASVKTAVRRLNQVMQSAQAAFASADAWLSDEQMRADARSAIWKANVLIEQATEALGAVAQAATAIQTDSHDVAGKLLPVMDQMSKTLEQVERLASDARTGEGTVGQLVTNPDLYQSLTDAATRMKESLAELQLLLRKIRDEGLNMQF